MPPSSPVFETAPAIATATGVRYGEEGVHHGKEGVLHGGEGSEGTHPSIKGPVDRI